MAGEMVAEEEEEPLPPVDSETPENLEGPGTGDTTNMTGLLAMMLMLLQ